MTDFKAIFGRNIRLQTSDLTMSTGTEGELFYSDTDKEFKVGIVVEGWASGGNLNDAKDQIDGAGTQTSGIVAGGNTPPHTNQAELYNGSAWTEVANLNTSRRAAAMAGAVNTAALTFGGVGAPNEAANETEVWDGSSWTEVANLNTARDFFKGIGTSTAALGVGGNTGTGGDVPTVAVVENWNGSGWTEVGDINTARADMGAAGTTTSGLVFGGGPTFTNATESFNGTSWTEVANLNTTRNYLSGTGANNTAALAFSGATPPNTKVVVTERWDGTSWTEINDMSTGRNYLGGAGISTAALAVGGGTGTESALTEEFNPVVTLKTVTDS